MVVLHQHNSFLFFFTVFWEDFCFSKLTEIKHCSKCYWCDMLFPAGQDYWICWWVWSETCRYHIWVWDCEENRCKIAYLQAYFLGIADLVNFSSSLLFPEAGMPILVMTCTFLLSVIKSWPRFVLIFSPIVNLLEIKNLIST